MCSYYIIFAPEKLSIVKNPCDISCFLPQKNGSAPAQKPGVLWYTDRVLKTLRIKKPIL